MRRFRLGPDEQTGRLEALARPYRLTTAVTQRPPVAVATLRARSAIGLPPTRPSTRLVARRRAAGGGAAQVCLPTSGERGVNHTHRRNGSAWTDRRDAHTSPRRDACRPSPGTRSSGGVCENYTWHTSRREFYGVPQCRQTALPVGISKIHTSLWSPYNNISKIIFLDVQKKWYR